MEATFILALFRHGYKARTSTLFHLLKGRRTSSVLIYGFLYDCLRFIDFFPKLTEVKFNQLLTKLAQQGLLEIDYETNEAQITTAGLTYLENAAFSLSVYSLIDNYRFGKNQEEIWRMLQFSVQVTSHLSYQNNLYIPLESSPLYQRYLKQWLNRYPKNQLISLVKANWLQLFSKLPESESNYLAAQLSGYQVIGKASQQLQTDEQEEIKKVLFSVNTLHHLFALIMELESINEQPLQRLIAPFIAKNQNQSMKETQQLLLKGATLEEVANYRKIKQSTVYDHVLELAICGDINSLDFIQESAAFQFLQQIEADPINWQYRALRKTFPKLHYLDFRLFQLAAVKKMRGIL